VGAGILFMKRMALSAKNRMPTILELQPGCKYQIILYHQIIWSYQQVDKIYQKDIERRTPELWNFWSNY
jgi:hypothetical protein